MLESYALNACRASTLKPSNWRVTNDRLQYRSSFASNTNWQGTEESHDYLPQSGDERPNLVAAAVAWRDRRIHQGVTQRAVEGMSIMGRPHAGTLYSLLAALVRAALAQPSQGRADSRHKTVPILQHVRYAPVRIRRNTRPRAGKPKHRQPRRKTDASDGPRIVAIAIKQLGTNGGVLQSTRRTLENATRSRTS